MPFTSSRGQDIDASPIRKLLPFADQAKAQGKHIYHLNIGQPDIETPAIALDFIKTIDEPIIKYGPSEGLPHLRKAVAKYYDKFNAGLTYEDVYVTVGASEAILFTLLTTCDDHDEVIIPEPFYANYLGFANLSNVSIIPITTTLETQFALPTVEQFEALITPKTKAIFLCNPGNPTGQMYSKAELQALMQLVKKHNLFLIVDEVYREFCYDQPFTSVLSMPSIAENVVVIDSISKVFSACGARIGYLITKNAEIRAAVNKYAQLRLCPSYFGQQMAFQCYQNPTQYIAEAKAAYQKRRALLYNRLSQMDGVVAYKPTAAFYNIATLPVADAEDFCVWLLTDFELDGNTVMLAPANGFYFNKAIGKQQVRIAYILNENDLAKAMDCLEKALVEYGQLEERRVNASYH